MKHIFLMMMTLLLACIPLRDAQAADINIGTLRQQIDDIIAYKKAKIGVAVWNENDSLTINNDEVYPLMSLFKLHVAIAALKRLEAKHNSIISPSV